MHIHCDEDLMQQFDPGDGTQGKTSHDRDTAILGSWQATIIKAFGSQFLLYVHTKSLYSTIDFMDSGSHPLIAYTLGNLRGKILEMLNDYYFLTDKQEEGIIQPFKNITFGPVENKRMARITQGIVLAYQKRLVQVRRESASGEIRLWELEDHVNNIPRRNLGGATPAETLRQMVCSGIN
jgi:hypothetical protein